MTPTPLSAVIDLGSNSFKLKIARFASGKWHRVDFVKETLRLGQGLQSNGMLSEEAMLAGWQCLQRLRQHLARHHPAKVRAVATQTLREARNRDEFLEKAEQILGVPIEVLSGEGEASLIYQGVAHWLPQAPERRLVIDIGGRSTEIIYGHGHTPLRLQSCPVGNLSLSMKYFPDKQWTPGAFQQAQAEARTLLGQAHTVYAPGDWDAAYGASGSVSAVSEALAAAGGPTGQVTAEGLQWLQAKLIEAGQPSNLRLKGIPAHRHDVIGGALSVLCAAFELFPLQSLQLAAGGLTYGVLCEGATVSRLR